MRVWKETEREWEKRQLFNFLLDWRRSIPIQLVSQRVLANVQIHQEGRAWIPYWNKNALNLAHKGQLRLSRNYLILRPKAYPWIVYKRRLTIVSHLCLQWIYVSKIVCCIFMALVDFGSPLRFYCNSLSLPPKGSCTAINSLLDWCKMYDWIYQQ